MGKEKEKIVFLTHQQLLEKYSNLKQVFYDEDLLIMLLDGKFIYGYALTPREIELGKDYVYKDSDCKVPKENMTNFYEEKSVLALVNYRNSVIQNLINLTQEMLNKKKTE